MEKRFSVLLCAAVLLSAASIASAENMNTVNYSTNDPVSINTGETWNISGKLTNTVGSITNEGSVVANAIESSTSITGSGSLQVGNGTSNLSGTVTQGIVNVTGGTLNNSSTFNATTKLTNNGTINNTSSIVAAAIDNRASITGTGTLTASGSNSGTIQQSSVALNGNLTNTKTIKASTLTTGSNKLINNSGATVKITSSASGTIEGTGTTELQGTSSANITQSTVKTTGELTNTGSITTATLNTAAGKLTNNSDLKVTSSTVGEIDGAGSMEIAGTNNASINQGSVTVTGDLDNQGSIIAATILNNTGVTLDNNGILGDSSSNITNKGTLNNNAGGSIIANSIDNQSDFVNNSSVTTNTIKNAASISGDNGSLVINNGGSSSGSITQNNVTISGSFDNDARLETKGILANSGTITNTSEIVAAAIDNTADIKGAGNITIGGGENGGTIEQADVTINGALTNDGTIASSGNFTNYAVVTGKGTLNINDGLSTGRITQDNVNISGTFTNNAALNVNELLKNEGTITNNNVITAVINNTTSGVIEGTNGTININGASTNDGSIAQTVVNVASGTLNNSGTIVANNFTNNAEISGRGDITVNTGGTNTGSITQNSLTNKGAFVNDGSAAKVEVKNLVNSGTIEMKNGSAINVAAQQEVLGGVINVSEGTNTLGVTGAAIESDINIRNSATLKTVSGTISDTAKVNITNTSTLNIAGADVTLNSNDSWVGSISLDSGSLIVDGVNSNGKLVATAGSLDLKTGSLNIGSGSSIADAVVTNIEEDTTLNIQNGGKVALNAGDTWEGKIILGTSGAAEVADLDNIPANATTLDVKGLSQTGTLLANNGVLLLGDKDLDIQGESYIEKAVAMELGGNIKVSNGGRVAIDDNDKMTGSAPTVTLSEGGTLNYGKTLDSGLVIKADAGNLNLLADSNLTFKEGSIADSVAIDIQKGANLTLDASTLNLDNQDTWNGNIINNGGIINANGLEKSSSSATLTQYTGDLNLYNDSNLVLGTESYIKGTNITIVKGDNGENGSKLTIYGNDDKNVVDGGNMVIDEYSEFKLGSGTFKLDTLAVNSTEKEDGTVQAGLVNVMNGMMSDSIIGELVINQVEGKANQANFNIDIYARSNKKTDNDTFIIEKINPDATAYINEWGLGGDLYGWDAPIDRHIKLKDIFFDATTGEALKTNIEVTDQQTFTPIGWYQLNKNEEYENIIDPATGLPMVDPATGMIMKNHVGSNYTLDLVKYNPQVFRGQVATVAQWMNQLNIDDMLFTHSMVLPSFKDPEGGTMANRYAAESPLFAPYQYSRKDGGLWYKMYGTFENLQMNNGLSRVGNNAYGALIGADFGLKDLKNGWKFMPTAYVGYNGAHQTFAHMGQYQNGGQAGFLGTWYKDNIILGALAYGGIYDNSMDVRGFNDSTFNYFAGAATKASYNIRLHRDWVLQPNLFVAYNYFGQQNWHSRFGQMGMMAGQLNGVNIAPGLNLIWEKETFSAYATLQYMYNINGACGGRAGNVDLPKMEMDRGYIQYGLGINKKFTNRASGYLQAVLRNVGRTGVGFQAGFNYMIGK